MFKSLHTGLLVLMLLFAAGPAHAESVVLRALSFEQWQQQLKTYRGQILVVDLWATWCTPCLEQYPKLIALDRQYAKRGVRVAALNLDDRDDPGALQAARRFIAGQGPSFDNFHLDENLMKAFDQLGLMAIPVVLIYDAQGVERYRLTGDNPRQQFTVQDVERAIQTLLDEASR